MLFRPGIVQEKELNRTVSCIQPPTDHTVKSRIWRTDHFSFPISLADPLIVSNYDHADPAVQPRLLRICRYDIPEESASYEQAEQVSVLPRRYSFAAVVSHA